ncbi:UTP--glucose-1-phosphate uridylyltransferase [Candidatus Woesearchaeota archaeon]|nr:UTP--glucose-1-phosphate uridylyltransferase [Candidatus Woesearchaeota archaeon]
MLENLKEALKNQPEWVFNKALDTATKYMSGNLISKFDSSKISPLFPNDVVVLDSVSSDLKKKYFADGESLLKNSGFAYFTMAGGISTSMGGCSKALVDAKAGKTFLEIKLDHIRYIQKKYSCSVPFILMVNEETDVSVMNFLNSENRLRDIDLIKLVQPVTVRFVEKDGVLSVAKLSDGTVSYAPGGHYDSFLLLCEIKDKLKQRGIKTIFINNIDNLGATIEPELIGCHLSLDSLFTPEVTRREKGDKGGPFVRYDGAIRLLEGPLVPDDYKVEVDDFSLHKYFNTNLIYLQTDILDFFEEVDSQVPIFINKKEIGGIKMFGFEAAVGLVCGTKKSGLISVDRQKRFLPIKYLADYWLLKSNFISFNSETSCAYQVGEDKPLLNIPESFLGNIDDFNSKIADGGTTTDFLELKSLTWNAKDGKVGSNVKFIGDVVITEEKSVIENDSLVK